MKRPNKHKPHKGRRRFSSKFDTNVMTARPMGEGVSMILGLHGRLKKELCEFLPEVVTPVDFTGIQHVLSISLHGEDFTPKAAILLSFEQLASVQLQILRTPDFDDPLMKYNELGIDEFPPFDKLRQILAMWP